MFRIFTCFQILHKIWKFCKKFVQLIFRKIFKFAAITCQILRLTCTKLNFGSGSAPDPTGRAYNAPRLPAGFRGATSKGKKGVGHVRVKRRRDGMTGDGRGGDLQGCPQSWKNTLIAELIWLAGAATQTFAPGAKHPRAATVQPIVLFWY